MAMSDCPLAKADAVTGRQMPNLLLRGMAHADTSTAIAPGEGESYLTESVL